MYHFLQGSVPLTYNYINNLSIYLFRKILKCKEATQKNMLIEGITEMLFKASGGKDAVFCLTGDTACFEPPNSFLNDAITEKVSNKYFEI